MSQSPERKMIGIGWRSDAICRNSAQPRWAASITRQEGTSARGMAKRQCCDVNVSACHPAVRIRRSRCIRVERSASTTKTIGLSACDMGRPPLMSRVRARILHSPSDCWIGERSQQGGSIRIVIFSTIAQPSKLGSLIAFINDEVIVTQAWRSRIPNSSLIWTLSCAEFPLSSFTRARREIAKSPNRKIITARTHSAYQYQFSSNRISTRRQKAHRDPRVPRQPPWQPGECSTTDSHGE